VPPDELVERRSRFGPHELWSDQVGIGHELEPGLREAGRQRHACIDNERQCRCRERVSAETTSGMGRPDLVVLQPSGRGSGASSSRAAARSGSSITCCVPILRARSRPERIHRRIVSGSRPARCAAWGTVSIARSILQHHPDGCVAPGPPGAFKRRPSSAPLSAIHLLHALSHPAEAWKRLAQSADASAGIDSDQPRHGSRTPTP